jgi:hypothetical protein
LGPLRCKRYPSGRTSGSMDQRAIVRIDLINTVSKQSIK